LLELGFSDDVGNTDIIRSRGLEYYEACARIRHLIRIEKKKYREVVEIAKKENLKGINDIFNVRDYLNVFEQLISSSEK
jgi:hypothetical protein